MKFLNWFRRTLRNIGINTPGFTEFFAFGGGTTTAAGVRVTEGNALLISTVYQCVRVIELAIRHGNEKGSIYGEREMRFL